MFPSDEFLSRNSSHCLSTSNCSIHYFLRRSIQHRSHTRRSTDFGSDSLMDDRLFSGAEAMVAGSIGHEFLIHSIHHSKDHMQAADGTERVHFLCKVVNPLAYLKCVKLQQHFDLKMPLA